MRKIVSLLLALLMVLAMSVPAYAAEKSDDIVVLFTNDVHCAVDENLGYAGLAYVKKTAEAAYKYVALVDCGDAIQGAPIGTLSKGSYLVDIMNYVGYDYATFGNHEFDYQIPQLKKLVSEAKCKYLSCNFSYLLNDGKGLTVDDYAIATYGDVKVAYVGITTPESFTKSTPAYFQDAAGNDIYSFAQGNNGKDLYQSVQTAVNSAIKAGADYVVALAHLGNDEQSSPWTSREVIANTTGIDAVLDGHSHEMYSENVKNKAGDEVLLAQTGTGLKNIGALTISDTEMTAEIFTDVKEKDADTTKFIDGIKASYEAMMSEKVAVSAYDLTTKDAAGSRAVRSQETNLGDLAADAYRLMMKADIGFVNGGGVRADIKAGDITKKDIFTVFPFSNRPCVIRVTGQQVMDALEMGARSWPGENGGFLQVSGLIYRINGAVPSPVVLNDKKEFVKTEGAHRVTDVKVLNSKTGAYEALDLTRTYTLAGHDYMLLNSGDGYTMFKGSKVVTAPRDAYVDNVMLIEYFANHMKGSVGAQYAKASGTGRITIQPTVFVDIPNSFWALKAVQYVTENKILSGSGTRFYPNASMTRGQLAAVLYRMAGSPAVSGSVKFSDVKAGKYYSDAVVWAGENGIVGGYADGTFRPDNAISRQQIAAFLYRYAKFMKVDVSVGEDTNILSYTDAFSVAEYAMSAMQWACGAGIINGSNNSLNPTAGARRAQVAVMLDRYLEPAA